MRAPALLICLITLPSFAADDLAKRTENQVFRAEVTPHWLPDGQRFWYRVQIAPKQHEFVLINAATGARQTAPDLKSMGIESDLTKSSAMAIDIRPSKGAGAETTVTFVNELDRDVDLFWINLTNERIRYGGLRAGAEREMHTYAGHVWLITSSQPAHHRWQRHLQGKAPAGKAIVPGLTLAGRGLRCPHRS
jgi:dipeptidyl-peptidase 4